MEAYEKDEEGELKQDLCRVYTEDNQNYTLRLVEEAVRTDGMQVTIDDVFFTYDEIIRQNKWGIESLNIWNTVTVALEDGKLNVTFPTATSDNANFFTNYILPKHILANATLDQYRTDFALVPIWNNCATILSQNKDINSLIFDLNACTDTNFAYYQIKNYGDFESFEAGLQGGANSIVDVYESPYSLEGFTEENILTSTLMGVFFNTDSEKVKVRLRRSLGGLIYSNFYTGNYERYLKAYDGTFFNYYVSEGDTVQELISRVNLEGSEINQQDLRDSGAKELPDSITINGVDRKFIFFLQLPEKTRNLEIKFNNEFESIKITAPDGSTRNPRNYNKKDKKVSYPLNPGQNLKIGSNQYTIEGVVRGKTYTIASIDLYVFERLNSATTGENQWKLNVLYYSDPASIFVAQQMRSIFREAGILENFIFEEVFNPEELEGKLLMGSYDLYIGSVSLGSKNNILGLFATEDALLNPSKYRNPILTSLIRQYTRAPSANVVGEINVVLAQDMPIVLLGTTYTPLQMKDDIAEEVFSGQEDIYEDMRRHQIYSEYSIVHNTRIDSKNAFNWNNFTAFILNNIARKQKAPVAYSDGERGEKVEEQYETVSNHPFEGLVAPSESIELFGNDSE